MEQEILQQAQQVQQHLLANLVQVREKNIMYLAIGY